HTRDELAGLLSYEQISLAAAQRCSGLDQGIPLFTSLLNYLHITGQTGASPSSEVEILSTHRWSNYPIVVSVEDDGAGFTVHVQTERRVDPNRVARYLQTTIAALLEALECAPNIEALRLEMLPECEQREILYAFNATDAIYPRGALIHERFEEQVEKAPNAVAVVSGSGSLTYAELNAKANQLAWFLRGNGVQIGEFIPVRMTRSIPMVIAQIAILKCGGVYIPVDPNNPEERTAFVLKDCGARRALTWEGVPPKMGESIQWFDCAEQGKTISSFPDGNLRIKNSAQQPAYVMYTSGSTGSPKGVIVPHRAVLRLVINTNYIHIDRHDCVAHTSNAAFDASTFEVWGGLLNGARLVIVSQKMVLDPTEFANVLLAESVTILWMTVGLLSQYIDNLAAVFPKLHYLITGGDVVEPHVVARVFR